MQKEFRSLPHVGRRKKDTPVRAALAEFRGALCSCGLITATINVMLLASPLFMLQVYDRVLTSHSLPTLVVLTVLLAGLFVMAALLEIVRGRLIARVAAGFHAALSRRCFQAILDLELTKTAQTGNQPVRDLETLGRYLTGPGVASFFDLPWVPIYVALSFVLHPLLGALTVASGLLLFTITLLNESQTKRWSAASSDASHTAHALLENARKGAEVLRSMGMESACSDRWLASFRSAQSCQTAASDKGSLFNASSKHLRIFLQSASLALGAALAIKGEVSYGTIIAASIIMSRALAPVEQLTGQWGFFQSARRAYRRLTSVLAAMPPESEPMALPPPKGRLTVDNVTIAVPGRDSPLVTGVNFTLEPGEVLGVVGPSGSGKSTLARALVGVLSPTAGDIRLDGARLDHWPRSQLGAAVGYIPQDVELFAGTISDNIARFAAEPSPAAVVAAAQRAGVHEMILRLPEGYAFQVGDRGSNLSAGQRQRIALARALYGAPKLLVLDEPNSNLDGAGEEALGTMLNMVSDEGVATVLISHRPLALRSADKVLVLNQGRQPAFGPREQILKTPSPPAPVPPQRFDPGAAVWRSHMRDLREAAGQ
jgi:ATP-binding cassette, subfamily C, bacterial EexD